MNSMGAEDLNRAIEMEQLRLANTAMIPLGILSPETAKKKGLELTTTEHPFFIGYKDHPAPSHTQLLSDEMVISVRMPCKFIAETIFTIDAKPDTIGKAIYLLDNYKSSSSATHLTYHDALEYAVQPPHKNLRRLLVTGSLMHLMDALARSNAYDREGATLSETLSYERSRLVPLLTVRNLGRAIARVGTESTSMNDLEKHKLNWRADHWIENSTLNTTLDDELPNKVRLRHRHAATSPIATHHVFAWPGTNHQHAHKE